MSAKKPSNGKLHVLVVDHSPSIRAAVTMCMKIKGIPVRELYQAGNAREGLAILKTQRKETPDVAVVLVRTTEAEATESAVAKITEDVVVPIGTDEIEIWGLEAFKGK